MSRDTEVIAVVNSDEDRTAVWYVHVAPEIPIARLCGAWVISDVGELRNLLADRSILFIDDDPAAVPAAATELSTMTMDPDATLCAVRAAMSEIEAIHGSSLTVGGRRRASLKWPTLPSTIEWSAPPPPGRGVALDDKLVSTTIGVASWVVTLAESWKKIETIRTSREHLRGDYVGVRPLPVVASLRECS